MRMAPDTGPGVGGRGQEAGPGAGPGAGRGGVRERADGGSPEVDQEHVLDLLQDLQLPEHVAHGVALDALLLVHVLHGVHLLRIALLHDAHLGERGALWHSCCRRGCEAAQGGLGGTRALGTGALQAHSGQGGGSAGRCWCPHPSPALTGGLTVLNPSTLSRGAQSSRWLGGWWRMSDRTPQPEPGTQEAPMNDSCHPDVPPLPTAGSPHSCPTPSRTEPQCHSAMLTALARHSLPGRGDQARSGRSSPGPGDAREGNSIRIGGKDLQGEPGSVHKTVGCTASTASPSKSRRGLPRTRPRAISEVPAALGLPVFKDQEQGDLDAAGRVWASRPQVPRPQAGPELARRPSRRHVPSQTRGVQPPGDTRVPSAQGPSWEMEGLVPEMFTTVSFMPRLQTPEHPAASGHAPTSSMNELTATNTQRRVTISVVPSGGATVRYLT